MSKLLDVIRDRRSDRHFANKPLEAETIEALHDAFRWAPSSNNRQPWRVLIASGAEAVRIFDDALSAGNKQWAPAAPLKMVIIGVPEEQPERNGLQNFMLDVGLAMENMMVQGYAMGLTIHAMAGFDYDKICKGDPVSDTELQVGVEHYSKMAELLMRSGPVFKLASNEANRVAETMISYANARKQK